MLGLMRARLATLQEELALALDSVAAYRLQLAGLRAALWRTILWLAGPVAVLSALSFGIRLGFFSALQGHNFRANAITPVEIIPAVLGFAALNLLLTCGQWLCLVEWQALLLVRYAPKPATAWVQALPLGLWLLAALSKLMQPAWCQLEDLYSLPRDLWLYLSIPLGFAVGLALGGTVAGSAALAGAWRTVRRSPAGAIAGGGAKRHGFPRGPVHAAV